MDKTATTPAKKAESIGRHATCTVLMADGFGAVDVLAMQEIGSMRVRDMTRGPGQRPRR